MTERNRYVLSCRGRHLHLTESVLVGRSETCGLVLHRDDEASRIHARLFVEDGVAYVEDLHSTNGVYVGGERIVGRRRIALHDSIRIGTSLIAVCEATTEASVLERDEPDSGSRAAADDSTWPTDVLAVLQRKALEAIRGRDPDAAERLTSPHLLEVRHEVEDNR